MSYWQILMSKALSLGWYTGRKDLITITIKGEFEGWSGRATECWEHRFFITSEKIVSTTGEVLLTEINVEGKTLEEASMKALEALGILEEG
jgi:hypothetical protein